MLKEFKREDISSLLELLKGTDAKFLLQFSGPQYKYPLDEKQIMETLEDDNNKLFKFVDESTNEFLGHCQLVRIDMEKKCTSVGRVLINKNHRGRGLGREMISQLISYSRDNLGLKELDLRVYDFNESAFKCYQNLGFKETGRQSNYFESVDETWTSIAMTIEL